MGVRAGRRASTHPNRDPLAVENLDVHPNLLSDHCSPSGQARSARPARREISGRTGTPAEPPIPKEVVYFSVFTLVHYCMFVYNKDLSPTQRYMHLSPAAPDAAIRLLDEHRGAEGVATLWLRKGGETPTD